MEYQIVMIDMDMANVSTTPLMNLIELMAKITSLVEEGFTNFNVHRELNKSITQVCAHRGIPPVPQGIEYPVPECPDDIIEEVEE